MDIFRDAHPEAEKGKAQDSQVELEDQPPLEGAIILVEPAEERLLLTRARVGAMLRGQWPVRERFAFWAANSPGLDRSFNVCGHTYKADEAAFSMV